MLRLVVVRHCYRIRYHRLLSQLRLLLLLLLDQLYFYQPDLLLSQHHQSSLFFLVRLLSLEGQFYYINFLQLDKVHVLQRGQQSYRFLKFEHFLYILFHQDRLRSQYRQFYFHQIYQSLDRLLQMHNLYQQPYHRAFSYLGEVLLSSSYHRPQA